MYCNDLRAEISQRRRQERPNATSNPNAQLSQQDNARPAATSLSASPSASNATPGLDAAVLWRLDLKKHVASVLANRPAVPSLPSLNSLRAPNTGPTVEELLPGGGRADTLDRDRNNDINGDANEGGTHSSRAESLMHRLPDGLPVDVSSLPPNLAVLASKVAAIKSTTDLDIYHKDSGRTAGSSVRDPEISSSGSRFIPVRAPKLKYELQVCYVPSLSLRCKMRMKIVRERAFISVCLCLLSDYSPFTHHHYH